MGNSDFNFFLKVLGNLSLNVPPLMISLIGFETDSCFSFVSRFFFFFWPSKMLYVHFWMRHPSTLRTVPTAVNMDFRKCIPNITAEMIDGVRPVYQ